MALDDQWNQAHKSFAFTMKFTAAAAVLAATFQASNAFVVQQYAASSSSVMRMSTTEEQAETKKTPTKKEGRLKFMKSDQFFRKGFKEVREDVENTMQEQFKSELVDDLKESNYVIERNGVKVYLAKVSVGCCMYVLFCAMLPGRVCTCCCHPPPPETRLRSFRPPPGLWILLGSRTKYCTCV